MAFVVLSAIELVALHLLLPWETVRIVVDVLSAWGRPAGAHPALRRLAALAAARLRQPAAG